MNITQTAEQRRRASRPAARWYRNHVFFFGAIDPQWDRTWFVAPASFPLASGRRVRAPARTSSPTRPRAPGSSRPPTGSTRRSSVIPATGRTARSGARRCCARTRRASAGLENFGGHNQTVRYNGILRPHWLIEASYARASNGITEIPSVNTCLRIRHPRRGGDPQRRHRLLREQHRRQQPVPGVRHEHRQLARAASNPLRRAVREHRLRQHHQLQRPAVHAVQRTADDHRRVGQRAGGSGVRLDLQRDPCESRERPEHQPALRELLRAGCLAVEAVHVPAGRPLRAAEAGRQPGGLHVRRQLGAALGALPTTRAGRDG